MKLDIKLDNTSAYTIVVIFTIVMLFLIVVFYFVGDKSLITIEVYENCSCNRFPTYYPFYSNLYNIGSEIYERECCYPNEFNCTKNCIYPIGEYKESGEITLPSSIPNGRI